MPTAQRDPCADFTWRGATPPDYVAALQWRVQRLQACRDNPTLQAGARQYYATRPIEFIEHWCVTYDPRNAGTDTPTTLPFLLFPRQREFVEFLLACLAGECDGLVEKSRDMGATWLCCAISVWLWLYYPGAAVGWGSLKADDVDRLGVLASIFEKLRLIVRNLPRWLLPAGYDPAQHATYMRLINPETGAAITGASGDNIGRGGRSLIYFCDESAHYVRPELIEASLGDNTRVKIDISSVNGTGNVFHRKRESGVDWSPGRPVVKHAANVFVLDWRDHPAKTQQWYDQREARARADGLLHVFRQEVDRNYAAAIAGVLIPPEWVRAAIDLHVDYPDLGLGDGGHVAALDVADGTSDTHDRNAYVRRRGVVLEYVDEWSEIDTGATARRAVAASTGVGPIHVQYDCIGVGAGVKAETNRLSAERVLPGDVRFIPWDAGAAALKPDEHVVPGDRDSPLNKNYYENIKSQGWWQLRLRCERAYRLRHEGVPYAAHELISIPSSLPQIAQIVKELSQPVGAQSSRLRLLVRKTPPGTRSPNIGDAIMMAFHPCDGGPLPYAQWV